MKRSSVYIFLICMLLCTGIRANAENYSDLWGKNGEKWNAGSRLPDFSFAGYYFGTRPLPEVKAAADVTKFGAKGNGVFDCTKAFKAAIKATERGAIIIPPGRYLITDIIKIKKSHIVLRGAGPEKTFLIIPKSLQQIYPEEPYYRGTKLTWAFRGAFIEVEGESLGRKLGKVVSNVRRGQRQFLLSKKPDIKPGTLVRLTMNNSPSLGRHIHGDKLSAGSDTLKQHISLCDWVAEVVSVSNKQITVDRVSRLDVRMEWEPELSVFKPGVEEVGIEGMTFEFPGLPKKKHLLEEGFSAIQISDAINCWARDIHIIDADNGIILRGSRFCTVENIVFKKGKRRGKNSGHHAFWASGWTQDCVFSGFKLDVRYKHDLTVEGFANGNVFRKGRAIHLNLDHHRNAPYENLFTDIVSINPMRLWNSGGRGDRGPHAGARETFWNLRYIVKANPDKLQSRLPDWPFMNVIGMKGYIPEKNKDGRWVEVFPGEVSPPDLYEAQLKRRLSK